MAPPTPCPDPGCDAGSPAIIYGQRLQPILAAADGVVTTVELDDAVTGAVTVTLVDQAGRSYRYAGSTTTRPQPAMAQPTSPTVSRHWPRWVWRCMPVRSSVTWETPIRCPPTSTAASDLDPVWPHLRLTIRDRDGRLLDTDRLVVAAQREACHVAIGPWSVPVDLRLIDIDDGIRSQVEVSAILNGGFALRADGTVTAHGRSALILAPEDCLWAPVDPFGPGAAGSVPPDDSALPFQISARQWVAAATDPSDLSPVALLRRG